MTINFGSWLKEQLKVRDMTQSELADKIGVYPPQVSRIISGERTVTTQLLIKIADALGLPREQVFSAAGILRSRNNADKQIEEIMHRVQDLSKSDRDVVLEFVSMLNRLRSKR
jgi:transcriptional regulator with XRE-family HTH domain